MALSEALAILERWQQGGNSRTVEILNHTVLGGFVARIMSREWPDGEYDHLQLGQVKPRRAIEGRQAETIEAALLLLAERVSKL